MNYSRHHCEAPDCSYYALHCPDCGEKALIDLEAGWMTCPTCGKEEYLPATECMRQRAYQVLAITGQSIEDWRARGKQLDRRFHFRWMTTLGYLHPVAYAAIVWADHFAYEQGLSAEEAVAEILLDTPELQRQFDAHPELFRTDGVPFTEDWF
jgi:hypothetical protein